MPNFRVGILHSSGKCSGAGAAIVVEVVQQSMPPTLGGGLGPPKFNVLLIAGLWSKLRLDQCKLIFYMDIKLAMKGSVYDGS